MSNEKLFELEERPVALKSFLVWMLLAYLFALAVRYIWVDWASQFPDFFWNGQLMINTNDGYYWAEGARDILAGGHQPHDLSPVHAPLAMATAFLARWLPVSFETLILWMPAVFGALLVVPVMLIGRALNLNRVGFVAALLAGVVWSYYNRTMVGYYDTDMLTIVLPTFVLWGIILAVTRKRNRYMALTALLMILYQWWYPAAYSLNTAFLVMVLLYVLVFERRELYNYKLLLFMLLGLMPLGWMEDMVLILAAFLLFHFGGKRVDRLVWPLLVLAVAAFAWLGGLAPIWFQIKGYLLRQSVTGGGEGDLHFFAVSKTVREAGKIPFEIFADRISGHPVVFLLSLFGYLVMAWRYRAMWLALPMLGLGFIAMMGGLRFTVYAVPVMALGMGYLIVWFSRRLVASVAGESSKSNRMEWGIMLLLTAAVLYPNIRHVIDYKVPTVFNKNEVAVLDRLHKIAGREDYVLAWWDYGYPIRYYSDVKTLIDGGKHTGDVNFPVSFALTHPQTASANMARLITEYTERNFRHERNGSYLKQMMQDYKVSDPETFVAMLEDPEFKVPKKSREVYYYLPLRMMGIFPTVALFSNIDLATGNPRREPLFYSLVPLGQKGSKVIFGGNLWVDLKEGTMRMGRQTTRLNRLVVAELNKDGTMRLEERNFDPDSRFFLVYMKNYRRFLLMDRRMFESTYVQLFVLRRYDPKLFEPVILAPMATVYRLKK
ncbi:STT3 domain-containing protein [Nitratifractor sp.]